MRGRVFKRGPSWSYMVDTGQDPATGKRRQVMKGGHRTRRDAEAALADVLTQAQAGTFTAPSRRKLRTFLEVDWLPAVRSRLAPTTSATYSTFVAKYVVPHVGAVPLAAVTPATLNGLYALLLEGGGKGGGPLAAKTVRGVHGVLRSAFADAVRWGMVPRNPATAADPPAVNRRPMAVWSPDQLGRFLASVEGDRLAAMWAVFATTGMRRSEVVGLPWSSVDLTAGRLAVTQTATQAGHAVVVAESTKTARSRRVVALDPATVAGLRAHRRRQVEERLAAGPVWVDTGLVFTREDGAGLDPAWVTKTFHRLSDRAGLPRIRLHDVRHSWATAALGAGVPLKVVSERLGHASVSITADTYQHVVDGMDRDAADRVAGLIFGSGVSIP